MAYYQKIDILMSDSIKEAITPFFDRVRFYPKPSEKCFELKEDFTIINLDTFMGAIKEIKTPERIVKLTMCIDEFLPIYDELDQIIKLTYDDEGPFRKCDDQAYQAFDAWKQNWTTVKTKFETNLTKRVCKRSFKVLLSCATKFFNAKNKDIGQNELSGKEVLFVHRVLSNLKPELRAEQKNQVKNQYDRKLLFPVMEQRIKGFEDGIPHGVDLAYQIRQQES